MLGRLITSLHFGPDLLRILSPVCTRLRPRAGINLMVLMNTSLCHMAVMLRGRRRRRQSDIHDITKSR